MIPSLTLFQQEFCYELSVYDGLSTQQYVLFFGLCDECYRLVDLCICYGKCACWEQHAYDTLGPWLPSEDQLKLEV